MSEENQNLEKVGDIISETEKLKESEEVKTSGKNGGARKGAGRKKGGKNKETITKLLEIEAIKERVKGNLQKLLDAQFSLAYGCSFLFKRITFGSGKNKASKIIQVKSPDEIMAYLNGEFDGQQDKYYFITTRQPDNKAIDSLFDRTYGKAPQRIKMGGDDDNPTPIGVVILPSKK